MSKKATGNRVFLPYALALWMGFPAFLFGHGVEVYDLGSEEKPVRAVYFKYSTGDPVSFAKIKLYPPSTRDKNVESLVSITDRNGFFCFSPDEAGEWRVDMEDGMGHKGTINVAVSCSVVEEAAAAENKPAAGRVPLPLGAALGLSLLANVFGIWFLAARAKRAAQGGQGYAHK
ncbi:MAG: hypothetical protein LBH18_04815 [Spirochaetaceae bacterium]|jgi:nickel transport protein|nr:hypothetical protein [Spirochaetaceae bacterium]